MNPKAPASHSTPVSETGRDRPATSGETGRSTAAPPAVSRAEAATRDSRSSGWAWLITVAVMGGIGYAGWHFRAEWQPWMAPLLGQAAPPTRPPPRPVPVVTAPVVKRDLDLYLNGLGTVTALNTVTVRSRVEGELVKVTFTEGQLVNEGDLLAEIDTRSFEVQRDQAAGQLARDEALLNAANVTLARMVKLEASKSVTTQQVDDQRSIVKQAEGTIRTDKALVAHAELQLSYCKITAPISGKIGLRLVDLGNIVRANDPGGLAVITQLQPIALLFTIPQDDIPRVQKRLNEGHELTVDAYDRDFKTRLASGKLLATDNQVDPTTGTLRLKAIFEKENHGLFPNQFVNTRLHVDTLRDAIVIPSAAVQRGQDFTFVYVAKQDDTAERRDITVGPSEGAETVVLTNLKEGELVITDGIDKLQPGSKISYRDKTAKGGEAARKSEQPVPETRPTGATTDAARGKDAR